MENGTKTKIARCGPSEVLEAELEELMKLNKDPAIASKIQRCHEMVNKLDSYLDDTASSPSVLQTKIWTDHFTEPWSKHNEAGTVPFTRPEVMISGHYEGQFLRMMAELTKAKRILEIGMMTGYSAVTFAESPFCEEMVALEILPFMATFVKERIAGTPVEKKIRIMIGAGADSLIKLKAEQKKFDLIFLDADKGGYINYYNYIMDNDMLEENGCFLCDNVLWSSDPYIDRSSQAGRDLEAFVKFVKEDDRVMQLICPIRDGVLVIKRKIA